MKCTNELLQNTYEERTAFKALHPTDEDLAKHPRSCMYIRNCFFKRLDTLAMDLTPSNKDAIKKFMFKYIEALLVNPMDASILPTWITVTDFQNLDLEQMSNVGNRIYFNANMDSSNKYLFAFEGGLFVTVKHNAQKTWLIRSKTGLPYKSKTLKKDLGIK